MAEVSLSGFEEKESLFKSGQRILPEKGRWVMSYIYIYGYSSPDEREEKMNPCPLCGGSGWISDPLVGGGQCSCGERCNRAHHKEGEDTPSGDFSTLCG